MQWAKQKQTGFTIVELLIVVVVIAILAAITVVAYNGVTQNARVSTAKSDLSNLNKVLRILETDGAAFDVASTWNKAFHQAGLYETASANTSVPKSFAICATSNTYAIGVSRPLSLPETQGSTAYYLRSDSGMQTLSWNASTPGSTTLARYCAQMLPEATFRVWSFSAGVAD